MQFTINFYGDTLLPKTKSLFPSGCLAEAEINIVILYFYIKVQKQQNQPTVSELNRSI